MNDWNTMQWIALAALIVLYPLTCIRVALAMRRSGRNAVLWFFLTLCLTAIPAMVVLWLDSYKALNAKRTGGGKSRPRNQAAAQRPSAVGQCPHCGCLLDDQAIGAKCPNCGKKLTGKRPA